MMLPDYLYRYEHLGVVEHEFCPVFVIFADVEANPNPEEVAKIRWISWQQFLADIEVENEYSEWCVEEAQLLQAQPEFRQKFQEFTSKPSND